mgnify:CR=1 FL=1
MSRVPLGETVSSTPPQSLLLPAFTRHTRLLERPFSAPEALEHARYHLQGALPLSSPLTPPDCVWSRYGKRIVCTRCGFSIRWRHETLPVRNCPEICAHLGEASKPIKVECQTCNGQKQVDMPTAECSAHGRCLPTYRPTDVEKWHERDESNIYHLCWNCPDFIAKQA